MSVVANKKTRHDTNHTMNKSIDNRSADHVAAESATPASIADRIDYVQRFSKQMILVIDDQSEIYSQLARQYLSSLSQTTSKQDMNVAFIAASSKINDIQMRCRLIEQLFANTLFDPEQSLAVSILRLAKQSDDTMTIVVEHAQALSLQIKYELCQLVDVAKKTQGKINVVLFGLEQAAQEVGQNKTIFDKKVSIIEASTGQVLALDDTRFKKSTPFFTKKVWQIVSAILLTSITIILLFWFVLIEYEGTSLVTLPTNHSTKLSVVNITETIETQVQQEELVKVPSSELATITDVYFALLVPKQAGIDETTTVAKTSEILQALAILEPINTLSTSKISTSKALNVPKASETPKTPKTPKTIPTSLPVTVASMLPTRLNEDYFLNSNKGYVIQVTGFSDMLSLLEFVNKYSKLDFYSYQKDLNGQPFIVLTSPIYSDKAQALAALKALPEEIKKSGSFLKSVAIIKHEINIVNN
ncbi:MAG: SPOR domain-containing protein [Colwellia sp.]|nr:SPOR domain-containing protein [Colwellia sp.]